MFYRAQLDREGDRWLVEFEDCPGCQTFGNSREHAIERAQEALEGWLESMLDLRRLPPRPAAKEGEPVHINDKLGVALQLRLAREEQGYSQAQTADRAGLSQQQIARLESPDNNPTLDSVIAAAGAVGLRLELVSDASDNTALTASPELLRKVAVAKEAFDGIAELLAAEYGPSANDNLAPVPGKSTPAPEPQHRRHGTPR
jgi:predicted RNase H-like HicB family nuclease/transcriptional regulator with XRE-family HTH domain